MTSIFKSSIEYDRVYVILWGLEFATHPNYGTFLKSVDEDKSRLLKDRLADLWLKAQEKTPDPEDPTIRVLWGKEFAEHPGYLHWKKTVDRSRVPRHIFDELRDRIKLRRSEREEVKKPQATTPVERPWL